MQTLLPKATSEVRGPCKAADLVAASTASSPGRPVWPGTHQNTTDFPGCEGGTLHSDAQC
jgi:hypothetical protein